MNLTVIQYKVKEGRENENRALVEKVFEDLERVAPPELRYLVLDLQDGSFLHVVAAGENKDTSPLTGTAAFRAFTVDHADRRSGEVNRSEAAIIGNYKMLSEPLA